MKQLLFIIILALLSIAGNAQSGYVRDAMYDKYGKDNAAKGEDWVKNMMSAKVEPEYKFPLMMKMHMTSYKNGAKKDENDITCYMNAETNHFAMRTQEERRKSDKELLLIYDYKANSMIMLNETEKSGVAMNLNAFMSGDAIQKRNEEKGSDKQDANCKKSGKTKTIQGYVCEEYVCTNNEQNTRSEIWISNKVPFDISQTGSRSAMSAYFNMAKGLGGMMMEGYFYENDELEMKIEVTNVNANENLVVKTSNYKFAMR